LKIGGEFEISLENLQHFKEVKESKHFLSGRHAFRAILRHLKSNNEINTLFLPEYLCPEIINLAETEGVDYKFYKLNSDLHPDTETLTAKENDVVLLINYFGIVNQESFIQKLKEEKSCRIILDLVQDYFSFKKKTSADYAFTGLRKFFHCGQGGLLKPDITSAKIQNKDSSSFSCLKIAAGMIKNAVSFESSDDHYLDAFQAAEKILNQETEILGNTIDLNFFISKTNTEEVARKRQENFKILWRKLSRYALVSDIPADSTPLCFPVKINPSMRNKLISEFKKHQIYIPLHWSAHEKLPLESMGRELAESEISLITDQRYGASEMEKQADLFLKVVR
jgi:hypothetical protein